MLTVDEARRATAHLAECSQCRDAYETFAGVKALFQSQPATAPLPESFWTDTVRRIRVESAPARTTRPAHAFPLRRVGAAVGLASILMSAILGPQWLARPSQPGHAVVAQDTLDDADLSSFVMLHADSAASQPLGDHDRQKLISTGAQTMVADDTMPDTGGNGETAF
jgi:predicted anti-sigma-YlaC factor YlaD